jgi:hypothetical protein
MRLLLILLLFAPGLFAIDMKDVDRDTLRHVRLALLEDKVRNHFGLRVGDFESLDQALDLKLADDKQLLVLRLKTKAAAVLIHTGKADRVGVHLFIEVETRLSAEVLLDGRFAALRCRTADDTLPEKTRLLRLQQDKLQLCLEWISHEEYMLENGRYIEKTTRTLEQAEGLQLLERREHLLDGKLLEGGMATSTTPLQDRPEGLVAGVTSEKAISVSTHCALARALERDRLNEAALHHARLAQARALAGKLAGDDACKLEALSLTARLEARLRPVESK